jgi:hypothetical protein
MSATRSNNSPVHLGVDLRGPELERYKEVRAARERMENYGVASPFVGGPNKRPKRMNGSDDLPFSAIRLLGWLQGIKKFRSADAASAIGVSRSHINRLYRILLERDLTSAERVRY